MDHRITLISAVVSLLGFAVVACGDGPTTPGRVDLSGQWAGTGEWTSDTGTDTVLLELSLDETENGELSGSGVFMRQGNDVSAVTVVSGSHSSGEFSTELDIESFAGRVSYGGPVRLSRDSSVFLYGTMTAGDSSVGIRLSR